MVFGNEVVVDKASRGTRVNKGAGVNDLTDLAL